MDIKINILGNKAYDVTFSEIDLILKVQTTAGTTTGTTTETTTA